MWKDRISLGLALLGLAGICVLVAWFWWPDLVGKLALWFAAASFTWKGFRAFQGKTGLSRAQATAPPAPATWPDSARQASTKPSQPQEPPENPSPLSVSRDSGMQGTSASPPPARTDHGEVWRAVKAAVDSTGRSTRRFLVVLILVLLVPLTLLLAVEGIVMLRKGDVPMVGVSCAVVGFLVWYCCGPLRRFWKLGEIELDDLNEVADMFDGSDE